MPDANRSSSYYSLVDIEKSESSNISIFAKIASSCVIYFLACVWFLSLLQWEGILFHFAWYLTYSILFGGVVLSQTYHLIILKDRRLSFSAKWRSIFLFLFVFAFMCALYWVSTTNFKGLSTSLNEVVTGIVYAVYLLFFNGLFILGLPFFLFRGHQDFSNAGWRNIVYLYISIDVALNVAIEIIKFHCDNENIVLTRDLLNLVLLVIRLIVVTFSTIIQRKPDSIALLWLLLLAQLWITMTPYLSDFLFRYLENPIALPIIYAFVILIVNQLFSFFFTILGDRLVHDKLPFSFSTSFSFFSSLFSSLLLINYKTLQPTSVNVFLILSLIQIVSFLLSIRNVFGPIRGITNAIKRYIIRHSETELNERDGQVEAVQYMALSLLSFLLSICIVGLDKPITGNDLFCMWSCEKNSSHAIIKGFAILASLVFGELLILFIIFKLQNKLTMKQITIMVLEEALPPKQVTPAILFVLFFAIRAFRFQSNSCVNI